MYTLLLLLFPTLLLTPHPALSLPQSPATPGPPIAEISRPSPVTLSTGATYWTSVETPSHITGCLNNTVPEKGDTTPYIDAGYVATMQNCLYTYTKGANPISNGFKGMDCEGVGEGFFLGAAWGYTSTSDCANACSSCLAMGIAAGSRDTVCYDVYGKGVPHYTMDDFVAHEGPRNPATRRCWMGFHATS